MFEVEDIRKSLQGRWVLDGASCVWSEPGCLVITGANGAGKSTLLRISAGIIDADGGDVKLAGISLTQERVSALRNIGYLPEAPELPPQLTVDEMLALTSALKSSPRATDPVLDALGVRPILHQRVSTLSLGQRRRACLAMALTGDPPLLLMDEPTNGLDGDGLTRLLGLLADRKTAGHSTVLATHDRAFAARIADAEAVLSDGKLSRV